MNADTEITWNDYNTIVIILRPKMSKFLADVATKLDLKDLKDVNIIEDNTDGVFMLGFDFVYGNERIFVDFGIIDSYNDTGEIATKGNLYFKVNTDEGNLIIDYIPYNYTDKIWTHYTNITEWQNRFDEIYMSMDMIIMIIKKHLGDDIAA